ncbi:hypothetical protein H696_03686 [Fonticula alba]|uniref:RecA family profile 1 domain-containing protein n=1 Tax=Fonticula alba TaxID=691883 RepID=A0A058Z4P2_FONAL|nr:hypothetical protein H696_03686 [Fonticula alba]KCV69259.1 hypothetical protein H696_03686 [Fonticula alba]|eukprot:XP_009495824.1 hypothetical protein H696_03686 [Fonticula alba]
MAVREFVPGVIEPSFGIGRLLYCILEHTFTLREEDTARSYFRFSPRLAPVKAVLAPLSNNAAFTPLIEIVLLEIAQRLMSVLSGVDPSRVQAIRRQAALGLLRDRAVALSTAGGQAFEFAPDSNEGSLLTPSAPLLPAREDATPVPTGLPGLDQILPGGQGLRPGAFIELVGEAGSGKSQLALHLALQIARHTGGQVAHITTEAGLPMGVGIRRLCQLLPPAETSVAENVLLSAAIGPHQLLFLLRERLLPMLKAGEPVRGLVLDSIAGAFRHAHQPDLWGSDEFGPPISLPQRSEVMFELGALLRLLSCKYGLIVMVTNQITGQFGPPEEEISNRSACDTGDDGSIHPRVGSDVLPVDIRLRAGSGPALAKPALGLAWRSAGPSTILALERQDEEDPAEQQALADALAVLARATGSPGQATCDDDSRTDAWPEASPFGLSPALALEIVRDSVLRISQPQPARRVRRTVRLATLPPGQQHLSRHCSFFVDDGGCRPWPDELAGGPPAE